MAAISTSAEYQLVREAIQSLTISGQQTVSVTQDGMSVQFSQSQLPQLREREVELAKRIGNANRRKRTTPDFSY